MPAVYLTEDDVLQVIDMDTSINVIEAAFRQLAEGKARNNPRQRAASPGIMLHTMSASAEYLGTVGLKAYTTTRQGARFHVLLYDGRTGELQAIIEADVLGQYRTGAASGVATEVMARPDSALVGLFGSGKQARTQLKAVCTVRKIERIEVYSRSEERCIAFADEMTELCGVPVVPSRYPNEVAAEKDIVICATTSKMPVFDGRVLDEGTHLNVVGSNFLMKSEIDATTVRRANHVVVDSIEQCRLEAGDFAGPLEEGAIDWPLVRELGPVLAGRETGRAVPEDITVFKSVGLAIQDVALGTQVLALARQEGLGRALPF